jgi:erythromycin esterase
MTDSPPATLDAWIARHAIPFDPAAPSTLDAAISHLLSALNPATELLALGEPLHGHDPFLLFRNQLFRRLVESHGYTAIAIESSYPRGCLVDNYIAHRSPKASYDAVAETGFSHGFGRQDPNRHLVEWMRQYNADPTRQTKLAFYGFDSPTEMTGADSPRQLLRFVLDYLDAVGDPSAPDRGQRIENLVGRDSDWSNPAASFDAAKSVGLTPAATALRLETEDLIAHLRLNAPPRISQARAIPHTDAEHAGAQARHLLNYHAGLARPSDDRVAHLLGIRDLMMADNLVHALARERRRGGGKVFAFAHNTHLSRGQARWQLGPHALAWWPAGAHVHHTLGSRYANIGAAVYASEPEGIAPAELGTFETLLAAAPGPARFIHTGRTHVTPPGAPDLPIRSASTKNSTYFPLTLSSLGDFDALVVLG